MGLGPCAIANRWERRPALGVFGRRGLDRKIVSCPDSIGSVSYPGRRKSVEK